MLLALLLLLAQPAHPTPTASAPAGGVYRTEIRERYQAFGYAGTLKLRIADGYVNGTYRPESGGMLQPVTGGTDGRHIWLDISTLGNLHVEAEFEHGKIVGMATPRSGPFRSYVFTATPIEP